MSTILADTQLPGLDRVGVWLNDPSNLSGPDGLFTRIEQHLAYTGIIVAVALAIGLPIGMLIGHTGRGVLAVVGVANALRAVPTLGAVILLSTVLNAHFRSLVSVPLIIDRGGLVNFLAMTIVLVLLALPPILTNTYAGVQNVDPAARDAARGMGMTQPQIVRRVEFPIALPLIISGVRSALLQVLATVAVAAYIPFLGGLGRYIADGPSQIYDTQVGYPAMVAAGVVIAVLAIVLDLLLALLQRLTVSPGLTGRRLRVRGSDQESVAPTVAGAHGY